MSLSQPTGSPEWNDEMYSRHPTPYGKGLAGFIQQKRIDRVIAYAEIGPRDRVLEIGCESGKLCAALPECARLVGCDISAQALADAEVLLREQKTMAEFLRIDAAQALPFARGEFDVVICSEMLEHVLDPGAVVRNIAAICNEKTRVVLTVPIEAPKLVIKRWLERLRFFHLLFPGIETGQSEWHLQAFSSRTVREIARPQFAIVKLSTVWGCHAVGRFRLKTR